MITAKKQPKWYQFRWRISNYFVKIARIIKPDNPEVSAFWAEVLQDQMIIGKSVIRVNPLDMQPSEARK